MSDPIKPVTRSANADWRKKQREAMARRRCRKLTPEEHDRVYAPIESNLGLGWGRGDIGIDPVAYYNGRDEE